MASLRQLVTDARACRLCEAHLPLGPRPVFQIHSEAKILIAAQAPGTKVHESGQPFTDASGDRLRQWLNVDAETFYDPRQFAIVPMGFCYPGRGKSGDLPPRPECADTWRHLFMAKLDRIELTLVIGQYARAWHLPEAKGQSLSTTVRHWRTYAPALVPLPHPSPRNNIWLKKNPWFEQDLVPYLGHRVAAVLGSLRPSI